MKPIVTSGDEYLNQPLRQVWFNLSMADPSAFILSLAYAVLFLDQIRKLPSKDFAGNPESAAYYSKSLSQLMPRLNHPTDCVSPGVISTILGLVCNAVRWSPPVT